MSNRRAGVVCLKAGRMTAAALAAACGLVWSASAQVPASLDRAPLNTEVAVAIKNIAQFDARAKAMTDALGVVKEEADELTTLLATPGLNKDGSAALLLLPSAGEAGAAGVEQKPQMVLVLPVSDYNGFVKGLGGNEGAGVKEVTLKEELGGRTYFIKDIGGGFAAMAQTGEELEAFEGKGGNLEAHTKAMGKLGATINSASDLLIVANMEALRPKIEAGLKQMKEQTAMMAQMAGPGGEQLVGQVAVLQMAGEAVARDATVSIIGVSMGEKGLAFDMGAQFKEGSPTGKLFTSTGKAGALASRVPNLPFYFAFAADLSSAGMKQLLKDTVAAQQANTPKDAPTASTMAMFAKQAESFDGAAMVMGASPGGLMGGLFTNTSYYIQTSKPAEMIAGQKEMMTALNGQNLQGITYKTTYTAGAVEAEGIKADQWSMQMQVDPNNPAAMQMQQMSAMFFGMGGGPGGYLAPVDGGVVMTMSPNTPLLSSAIKAAKEGNGMGADQLVKDAQANLPEGRTLEGYIGVKPIIDTVVGFMAMMGGGTSYQSPPQIAPIAMGGTTTDSAMRLKTFVPMSTMKEIGKFAQSMEGMGGEPGEEAPADEGAPPRF